MAGFAASDEMRAVDEPMAVFVFSISVCGSSSFFTLMFIVGVCGCECDEEGVGVRFCSSFREDAVLDFWLGERENDLETELSSCCCISERVAEMEEELSVGVSS